MSLRPKPGALMWSFLALYLCLLGCSEQSGPASANGPGQKNLKPKYVEMITNKGSFVLELDTQRAPVTVANFVRYAEEGFYDNLIFHRIFPARLIQGGFFDTSMRSRTTHEPIINESRNGLKNERGTIAMIRPRDPNIGATSQFIINAADNPKLDYISEDEPGFAVFGKVIEGMDVVDEIANAKLGRKGKFLDMPTTPIIIKSASVIKNK
jgi:cyclophilin family peptidyl-prolyl cis-trans isomerase